MSEEKRKYVLAQLNSLPNAFQYMEVKSYIEQLEQENQYLKEVNSFSKRELYKINKERLEANLKLAKENENLKLRIDRNNSILAIMNSKLEEENKELKEKLKMKEILCFNMPKGVDIICLTKSDYERNKYEYETYENLVEISEIYKIQRNRWKKHSHKLAMKCDRYRIKLNEIERYIKEHLTDEDRFLMLNEWQVPELLKMLCDGRKWINGRN